MMLSVSEIYPHKNLQALAISLTSFVALGTVSAMWENPLFVRMTPVGAWELPTLVVLSALTGVFAAVRRPVCSLNRAGVGNIAGFLGIACPTCNKILMLIFGGEALMHWFDPIRPLVSVLGLAILVFAISRELNFRWVKPVSQPISVGQARPIVRDHLCSVKSSDGLV